MSNYRSGTTVTTLRVPRGSLLIKIPPRKWCSGDTGRGTSRRQTRIRPAVLSAGMAALEVLPLIAEVREDKP